MDVAEISAPRQPGRRRSRGARILLGAAGAIAIASTAVGGSLASAATQSAPRPAVGPKVDVVGVGVITCKVATGEVGYSPASKIQPPEQQGPLTISIWFQASHCAPASGTGAKPVPRTVIGSISFTMPNGCPLDGWMGQGTLNLAYNYPPVPSPVMIDPSVAPWATVSNYGTTPYWTITGQVTAGSYLSTKLVIVLKPDVFGGQNCKSGITSEYISRAQAPFVSGI